MFLDDSTLCSQAPAAKLVALGLENRRSVFDPCAQLIFFPRIDDSHCCRIRSSLTTVHCFHDVYEEKQPVALKEYCADYW